MTERLVPAFWEAAVQWRRGGPKHADLVRDAFDVNPLLKAIDGYRLGREWTTIKQLSPDLRGTVPDIDKSRGIAIYALARKGFHLSALEPDLSALIGATAIRSLTSTTELSVQVDEAHSVRLPCANSLFDFVFAHAVLHQTHNLGRVCQNFFCMLRFGSMLSAVCRYVLSQAERFAGSLWQHPLHRLSRRLPSVRSIIRGTLAAPWVWRIRRPLLDWLDHHPGRLQSFVAHKP